MNQIKLLREQVEHARNEATRARDKAADDCLKLCVMQDAFAIAHEHLRELTYMFRDESPDLKAVQYHVFSAKAALEDM